MAHPIVRHQGRVRLYEGDSREVLKRLPDNSLDSIVCDPPYALVSVVKRFGADDAKPAKFGSDGLYARASAGFMGQKWDTGETAFAETFWAEVYRVLKPGGHVAAFGGTRTYHHLAMAIELAGFEIRDQLAWTYGTGFPKSHSVSPAIDRHLGAEPIVVSERETGWNGTLGGAAALGGLNAPDVRREYAPATPEAAEWEGWGTSLKPAWEPIALGRKPLSEKTVAANVLRWGTGAINIDGCRIGTEGGTTLSHQAGYGANGWREGHGMVALDKGRFPANILHDGSPEVLAHFPDSKGQRAPVGGQESPNAVYGRTGVRKDMEPRGDEGSAARFFYCAKASRTDREEGCEHLPVKAPLHGPEGESGGFSSSNSIGPRRNIHPTVKPTDVMRWLTRLITPPGGTVLDPFMGSGSTGKACLYEGFNFIGIDAQPEYIPIAEARIAFVAKALTAQKESENVEWW